MALSAAFLPSDVTVTEDVASNLNLSAVVLADVDTAGSITVVLTASAGTLTATTGGGVTISNSGTAAITLTGTVSAIDTFLNTASAIQYTGASNVSGNNAALLTITADDGSGAVTVATVNIDITGVNDAPVAVDDLASTPVNTPATIAVLANDSDVDGTPLVVTSASVDPALGTVARDGAGYSFVPVLWVGGEA